MQQSILNASYNELSYKITNISVYEKEEDGALKGRIVCLSENGTFTSSDFTYIYVTFIK